MNAVEMEQVVKAVSLRRRITKVQKIADQEIQELSDRLDALYETFTFQQREIYWSRMNSIGEPKE